MLTSYISLANLSDYTVMQMHRHNGYLSLGQPNQPSLVCLNKAAFFRVGEKVDFCET